MSKEENSIKQIRNNPEQSADNRAAYSESPLETAPLETASLEILAERYLDLWQDNLHHWAIDPALWLAALKKSADHEPS